MKHLGLVFAVLLATSGCASLSSQAPSAYATATTAELKGDAARPSAGHGWVRSELYFGVGEEQVPATARRPTPSARRSGARSWTRK